METLSASPVAGYSFAEFRLDLSRGCVTHAGQELRLRYQSFQLLRYFVEHPGVVLSKDELASAIWNETSVTDNALAQCIADIRRELKDDPHNPLFIKTFPKIGYRFIAPVEEIADVTYLPNLHHHSSSPILLPPSNQEDMRLERTDPLPFIFNQKKPLRAAWRIILSSFLTVFLMGLHSADRRDQLKGGSALSSLIGPPVLAVFPFSNETGRQDLDWFREGISDMILTNLAHTGRWNVLSREKVHELLDRYPSRNPVSLEAMLETARSAHAKDFIVGTVSMTGQEIAIRIETRDAMDSHLISSDTASLEDPREIVAEADMLSTAVSRHLGIIPANASPPLAKVMTSSADAYRYYSLGVEKAEQYQNAQAIELFKKAIDYDSQFGMAYARIGFEYAAQEYQPKLALPYLEHAVHLSQQLPPLNRLYIEAWSAMARSDADTAIGILRDITTQYPDETEAYRELSRLLRGQERVEEAATLLQVGIRKNPNAKELYDELGLILMVTKRPQEAIGVLKQYLALSPQNPNAHDSLGMAYQWAGQYEASETEFNQALQLDPEFEPSVAHLGDIYYHMGRYRDALVEYRHLLKIAVTSGDAKAVGFADISTVYRRMGDLTDAQTAATQEVRNNKTAVWESLVIALDKNDTEHARVLQRTLFSDPPNADRDSSRNLRMEFFYRGSIELRTGNPQQAVSDFKLALQHLPPSSGMDSHEDCLANAFLELGMFQDAITAYQSILNNNPRYPLGYYHLGISYYKAHDLQESKASFQRFLQANPSADQDSPAILEAKRILQSNAL